MAPEKPKTVAYIKDAAYEKSNRKMRSKYTKETGKTLLKAGFPLLHIGY